MTVRAGSAAPKKDETTGAWWFIVDLGQGADGKRRQARRRGFPDEEGGAGGAGQAPAGGHHVDLCPSKRQTLGEYLTEDWLPAVRRELAASTWESYQRNVKVHVVPLLTRFYGDLLASGRQRGNQSPGLKPRTVRYIHTILSSALNDAVKWQRLVVNPATRATPPSAGESKAPEMRTWTGSQVRHFLNLCEGDRYAPAFAFLALTGCRRGEALGLRWSDVDLSGARASIRQSVIPLTKAGGKGREGRLVARTKTDRARVIELDGATVAALRKWKAAQAAEILAMDAGYQDHGLIFCRPDGHPYHPESFSKTFDRRLGQPKYPALAKIRLHDLRHTWATLALAAGVDVAIVSKRLGHGSPMTTWQTYQHVVAGMQTDAAQRVAALIFGA